MTITISNFKNLKVGRSKTIQDVKDISAFIPESDQLYFRKKLGYIFYLSVFDKKTYCLNRAGNQLKLMKHLFGNSNIPDLPDNSMIICKSTPQKLYFIDIAFLNNEYVGDKPLKLRRDLIKQHYEDYYEEDICKEVALKTKESIIIRNKEQGLSLFYANEGIGTDLVFLGRDYEEDYIAKSYYIHNAKSKKDYIFLAYQYEKAKMVFKGKLRINDEKARNKAIKEIDKGHRVVCTCTKLNKKNVNLHFKRFKSGKPFKSVIPRFDMQLVCIPIITKRKKGNR